MRKDSLMMPVIILSLICLITTGLLSLTFSVTLEAREMQAELAANANRQQLFPNASSFEADPGLEAAAADFPGLAEAYTAKDASGKVVGFLFVSSYQGYSSAVPVMLAIGPDGKIAGIKILANDETPGLGKKVEQVSFYGQFQNMDTGRKFSVKATDSDSTLIDAVAGATISSRAVTEAVNIAVSYFRKFMTEVN